MNTFLESGPRRALVTGSARRVGRVIATHLISHGWDVVIHAKDASAASAAAQDLAATGAVGGDLRDPLVCRRVVHDACALLGGLDMLVCNAASFVRARPGEITVEEWAEAFDVSARAPMLLMQAACVELRAAGGSVVLISDRAAVEHWSDYAAHAAAKAALESLTISFARAWAPHIRVNAIRPGMVMPPDDWDEQRQRSARNRDDWQPLEILLHAVDMCTNGAATSGTIIDLADGLTTESYE